MPASATQTLRRTIETLLIAGLGGFLFDRMGFPAGWLAGAMTLMFVLAPSTRFGYFIYPAALVAWLLVSKAGRRTSVRVQPVA